MIYLGSDHGGYHLKNKIKNWLTDWGYAWKDLGNVSYEENDDYPKYAFAVAEKVTQDEQSKAYPVPWSQRPKGILCCRSSSGMVISANKVKGARCVAAFDIVSVKHSREHNDSNILALGGDFLKEKKAREILEVWLKTEFSGEERHQRRLKQIRDYYNSL